MSDIDIVWRAALVVIASMAGEFERIRVTLHRDGYGEHEYPCVVIDIAIPAGHGATMGGTCVLSDACARAVFSAESIIGANLREEVSRLRSHIDTGAEGTEGTGVNATIGSIPDIPEPEPAAAECASVAYPRWARDALDLLREASDGLGWTPDRRRTADAILRSAADATEYQSKQRAAEEIRGAMTVLDSMHAADDDNLTEIGQFLEAAMDALVHPEIADAMERQSVNQATSTVDGVIYAQHPGGTGDANYSNDGSSAAPSTEHQFKNLIPSRDGAYSVRLGRAWVEAEWDGDYLHVPGSEPQECDVVDEWGPWLRPLRPQRMECKPHAEALGYAWLNRSRHIGPVYRSLADATANTSGDFLDVMRPDGAPHRLVAMVPTRSSESKPAIPDVPGVWVAVTSQGEIVATGWDYTEIQLTVEMEEDVSAEFYSKDPECRSVARVESALIDLECETEDRGDPWHNGAWYVIRKIREAFDGTNCGSVDQGGE